MNVYEVLGVVAIVATVAIVGIVAITYRRKFSCRADKDGVSLDVTSKDDDEE